MNSFDACYGFQLNYDRIVDEQVKAVAGLHVDAPVHKRQFLLSLYRESSLTQFVTETRLIAGFEKSGSQLPMDAHRGAYDRTGNIVDPHSVASVPSVVNRPFEVCRTANYEDMPEPATRIRLGDL